jgi:AraC-like DNA-binding protein
MHAHHAMHLVVARSGKLRIREGNGPAREVAGVLTAPDVAHAIDARDTDVVLVFVDPESDAGERLRRGLTGVRVLSDDERTNLLADLALDASPEDVMRWATHAVDRFAGMTEERTKMHPRVRRLLRELRALPPDTDTSLASLAARAGLSEGRLVHVFRESLGIPLRPYLLWLKVQRAVVAFATAASLTQAAHNAGFSDTAHMSRTFRRMFGVTASELSRSIRRS